MWKIVNLKWCWKLSLKRPKGKKKKVQAKDLAKTKSSLSFLAKSVARVKTIQRKKDFMLARRGELWEWSVEEGTTA